MPCATRAAHGESDRHRYPRRDRGRRRIPERLTFAESVKSASAWGRAVASAIPDSARPAEDAPSRASQSAEPGRHAVGPDARGATGRARLHLADEDCLPVPFIGGEASWTLASTPPKPFGATSFGWHDLGRSRRRRIQTMAAIRFGSRGRSRRRTPARSSSCAPGGVPFFAHATGVIEKNPHLDLGGSPRPGHPTPVGCCVRRRWA